MPRYSKEITVLLRSVLWGEPPNIDTTILLKSEFWQEVRRYQLDNMFAVWTLNNGLNIYNSDSMKRCIFINLQRKQRQNKLLTDLITLLRRYDIDAVMLKGHGLALLYENPDMRDYSDVDIYIGEQNYSRAVQIVRSHYHDAYWFSESDGVMHFIMVMDENLDCIVELHRVTMELHYTRTNRTWQEFTQDEMLHTRKMELNGINVNIPSLTYDSLYIFIHAWHHFVSSGVGLRQMADWMLHLHTYADRLETGIIKSVLQRMNILEEWQTFGWVLVNKFGMPETEFPFYTGKYAHKGEKLYRQLMIDGHCGRETRLKFLGEQLYLFPFSRPAHGRLRQKIYTLCRLTFNTIQLAKLFPGYALREYIYSLIQHTITPAQTLA